MRDLTGHRRGGRALPDRVLEGERAGEPGLADQVQGVGEIAFRLAGEADDDVGGDRGVRIALRTLSRMPQVAVAAVRAAHALEDRVRPGLQRHVEAGHDVAGGRHGLDHVAGEVTRVRGGEADPLQALGLEVAAGPEQLAERELVAELGAVGVDVLAEQGDLEDAVGGERADLVEDVTGAAVPSFPRRLGTMQKVQVLLQPTEIDTHAEYGDSRRAGSREGKVSRVSSNSSWASWRCRACSSSLGRAPMLCVP